MLLSVAHPHPHPNTPRHNAQPVGWGGNDNRGGGGPGWGQQGGGNGGGRGGWGNQGGGRGGGGGNQRYYNDRGGGGGGRGGGSGSGGGGRFAALAGSGPPQQQWGGDGKRGSGGGGGGPREPLDYRATVVADLQQERPLWVLSAYAIEREGPNLLTGDVSPEEARWRAVDDVTAGRCAFGAAAAQHQEGVRAKEKDIEGLLQVGFWGGLWGRGGLAGGRRSVNALQRGRATKS